MEVGDVRVVLADRADDVAFHDLHVVDVEEELQPRGAHALDHLGAERGVVALVVLVIDLAVQQLQAERHTVLLGQWRQSLEAGDAVREAFPVGHAAAVAAEAHDVRHLRRRGERNHALAVGHELVVLVGTVESHGDAAEAVGHGAHHSVLRGHPPVLLIEQVDRLVPDRLRALAEVVEGNLAVAPARNGVVQPAGRRRGGKVECPRRTRDEGACRSESADGANRLSASHVGHLSSNCAGGSCHRGRLAARFRSSASGRPPFILPGLRSVQS